MSNSAGMGWWLDQIGRIPLLSPSQEIELGTMVQAWVNHPGFPDDCPPGIRRRGRRAKEQFVNANLRLAASYVTKRCNRVAKHHNLDDLVQAANLGLIRAVEKYDPTRGYRFSTYAYWWIRQSVNHWVDTQSRIIAIPGSHSQHLGKLEGIRRRLLLELNREPTSAELATELRVSSGVFEQLLINARSVHSLDATISEDGATLADFVESDSPSFEEQLEQEARNQERQQLHRLVGKLPKLHQRVLTGVYGLDGEVVAPRQLAKAEGITGRKLQAILQSAEDQLKAAVVQLTLFVFPHCEVPRAKVSRSRRRTKADPGQLHLPGIRPAVLEPSSGGVRKAGRSRGARHRAPTPPQAA